MADAAHARGLRAPPREHRPPAVRPDRRARTARRRDRGRRGRSEDPRGLGRLSGGDRRGAPGRRRARCPGLPAHRRAERVVRARGHRRGDRRTRDPRVPRRGLRRRPHPRPDRDRPRAQRLLLLHHADDPVRPLDRGRAAGHEADRPRGQPGASRRRRGGPGAGPSRDDGGGGTAARPRRDLDRELGLPGDGADRRDRPAHVPARARDEGRGGGGRGRERPRRHDDNERVLRYLAKVTEEPARVHGISHEVGSLSPAASPTSSCGRRRPSA